ncbi:MAG: transporter substrate-binding domain-containing protein [Burkholderiales bacterium]|jgi:glutamate/aspartate transport system substrate-binding protein|nr:transporter substrate-binding domain-containing protein [Burkholderiales bacterium]
MYKLFFPLSVALVLGLAAPVAAQELTGTLKKIKDTGTITIGHRESSIPLSYYDDKQQVVGYAMDLCMKVVDEVKEELKLPEIKVVLNPVTSATRIPLIANGTVDIECGSTTNNLERQKQAWFSPTYFVSAIRFVTKKGSTIKNFQDMKGKAVSTTAGTTSMKMMTELNGKEKLGINLISAKDHAEGFLLVESGRAEAFVMDDILIYGLMANSKAPDNYVLSSEALSLEPYAAIIRKDDKSFKVVVDRAFKKLYASGEVETLFKKWFQSPVPPRGVNLNVPLSDLQKKVFAHPTDSGDPKDYE